MLTHIAIAAHTGGVLNEHSLVTMLLGDDVYHTGDGIRAIERTRRTLHDFDFLDVLRVDERQLVLAAHITVDALAVNKDEDVGVSQTVELHLRAHIVLIESKRRSEATKDVLDALARIVAKHLACNHLGLNRGVLKQMRSARASHNHLHQIDLQGVSLRESGKTHAKCQQ